jgi:UDP-3-O-[3-hydroxymyristoyl] glucosamine N-acyltransferase
MSRIMTVGDLIKQIGGELVNATPQLLVKALTGVAPIESATATQVTFINKPEFARFLSSTAAGLVILKDADPSVKTLQLVHPEPYRAFAMAAQIFYRGPEIRREISERAFVATDAHIGKDVAIYPFAYVESGATIGDGAVLMPGAYVGEGASVGARTILHPRVTLGAFCKIGCDGIIHSGTVIGADGFGFAPTATKLEKVPQTGIVEIGDFVELGANCTIDRATMGATRIGDGTKLDNQVHLAHNVQVGSHCLLCAQASIAGSTRIGDWVIMAGQSGIADNLKVGDRIVLGARAGVIEDLDEPGTYLGFPVQRASDWHRQSITLRKLPDLDRKLRQLSLKLEELEKRP